MYHQISLALHLHATPSNPLRPQCYVDLLPPQLVLCMGILCRGYVYIAASCILYVLRQIVPSRVRHRERCCGVSGKVAAHGTQTNLVGI